MHGQGVKLRHVEPGVALAELGLAGAVDRSIGRVGNAAVAAEVRLVAHCPGAGYKGNGVVVGVYVVGRSRGNVPVRLAGPGNAVGFGFARVGGQPQVQAAHVQRAGIGRRHGRGEVVPALAVGVVEGGVAGGCAGAGHSHPGVALIHRAEDVQQRSTRGGRLQQGIHPVGIRRGAGQLDALVPGGGQARAGQGVKLGPGAGIAGSRAVDAVGGENAHGHKQRVVSGNFNVGHASRGRSRGHIGRKHGRPGAAAVLAAPQAAAGGRVHITRDGVHQEFLHVGKVGVAGAGQLRPGAAPVRRFPDARALDSVRVEVALASAAVQHPRLRGRSRHYGRYRQVGQKRVDIGPLNAGGGGVAAFPEATASRARPNGVAASIAGVNQQAAHAPGHVRGAALYPVRVGQHAGRWPLAGPRRQHGFVVAGGGQQPLAGHQAGCRVAGERHLLLQGQVGPVGKHAVAVVFAFFLAFQQPLHERRAFAALLRLGQVKAARIKQANQAQRQALACEGRRENMLHMKWLWDG